MTLRGVCLAFAVSGVGAALVSACQAPDFRDRLDGAGTGAAGTGAQGTGAGSANGTGAGGDAGSGGSGPFEVHVELRDQNGVPLQQRSYLVSDAEGAPLDQGTLSVNGTATVTVQEGWTVSVFEPASADDPSRYAYSARMVEGTEGVKFIHNVKTPATPVDVTVSFYCIYCGTSNKATLAVSCREPTTKTFPANTSFPEWTLNDYEGCPGSNQFDAYAYVTNSSGVLVAFTSAINLPRSGKQGLPEAQSVGPTADLSWNVSGAPGGFDIHRNLYTYSPSGREAQLIRQQGGTPSEMFDLVSPFVEGPVRLETMAIAPSLSRIGHFRRYDPFDVSSVLVDALALARPTSTLLDATVADRAGVAWTLGDGPEKDALHVVISSDETSWVLAVPPVTGGVTRIPALDGELAEWSIDAEDVTLAAVVHLDEPAAADYAAFLPTGVTFNQEERRDLNELLYAYGPFVTQ